MRPFGSLLVCFTSLVDNWDMPQRPSVSSGSGGTRMRIRASCIRRRMPERPLVTYLIWQRRDSDEDPSMLHTPTYAGEAFGFISHLSAEGLGCESDLTGIRVCGSPWQACVSLAVSLAEERLGCARGSRRTSPNKRGLYLNSKTSMTCL